MNSASARLQLVRPWLSARATIAEELIPPTAADPRLQHDSPPRTPSALKACALGGGKVELRWLGALDQRARFVIQRWTAAKGWSDVAAVPGYRTSFIDEQLTPYTTCAMRVIAEGDSGRSMPSNVARTSVR
jgi:hypothetical protein